MNAFIGDSRTRAFKSKFLGSLLSDNWFIPGGSLLAMEELIRDVIIMHHGEDEFGGKVHIYISAGLCDLTKKLKEPNYEEVIFDFVHEMDIRSSFLNSLETIRLFTLKEGAIPVFTTIYPMSLADWNQHRLLKNKTSHLSYSNEYPLMQSKLEESVRYVNEEIIASNVKTGVATPLIHKHLIHNRGQGKFAFKYNFLSDGCHPTQVLQQKVAVSLRQAITKNRASH